MCSWTFYYMELELNTIIGDPAKLGRDCEIHQHKRLIYSFIICYIRMIVFVGIIQILMFYKVISFSHWLPDGGLARHVLNDRLQGHVSSGKEELCGRVKYH